MNDFTNVQKSYMDSLFIKLTQTINNKTDEIRSEFTQQIRELKQEIYAINNSYEERISKLENQNKHLQHTVIQLQRRIRIIQLQRRIRKNLVIFGISSTEPDLRECVVKLFRESLEVDICDSDIRELYRVGSNNDQNKQPIIVEFNLYCKKLLVQKNARKLKGTTIAIGQDQCIEDRTTYKILLKHLKEARSKGIQAYIKGDEIVIGSETYNTHDLEEGIHKQISPLEKKNKSDSAPSTPDPQCRQKRLLDELGLGTVEIQQEQKKPGPTEKTNTKTDKNINKQIRTRSTSTFAK